MKAHLPNEPNKLCIPASSEAFLTLVYEGCYDKWLAIHKWQKENPTKMFAKENEECQKPIYKSRLFDSVTGQRMFGGVPPNTLTYFNKLKDLVKKGRSSKKAAKIEEACLALIQKEHNVLEEGLSSKKRKTKPAILPLEVKTYGDEE